MEQRSTWAVAVADSDGRPLLQTGQQILDPCILRGQGQEPTDYDYVVLKSAVHFRSNFTELAGAIVEVTGPGIHSSRMTDFVYKKVARPLWPLDANDGAKL